MKFFIDEDLPRSIAPLFRQAGFEVTDIHDTPLRGSKDWQIAAHIKKECLCLVTGDFDFADIRNYPPGDFLGLVVIHAGKEATADQIAELTKEFIKQEALISDLTGKLAIVEPDRIRIRQT